MHGVWVHSIGVTFKQIGENRSNDPAVKTKIHAHTHTHTHTHALKHTVVMSDDGH
jgi:hypothetical protein